MRTDPFDEYDLAAIVDRGHETIVVSLNIENYAICADDTRASVALLDFRRVAPNSALRFAKPRIQCRFQGFLRRTALKSIYEFQKNWARNHPHRVRLSWFPFWEQRWLWDCRSIRYARDN